MKYLSGILLSFLFYGSLIAQPCHCDHYIPVQDTYIDGNKLGVQPGDTVCIKAGKKKYLNLFNFRGTAEHPIVFINQGGLVEIGDSTWYYGCVINKSAHFVFTGTGDSRYAYGIKINHTKEGASGLGIGATDYDINHIEVSNTGFAGIMAKIDPNCDPSSWQENFVMQNISFHHNYVHDTGGEGFYIGYTGGPKTLNCEGISTTAHPHNIEHIRVFSNRVENTGWDGIQVSRAIKDCEIYNNQVFNYGEKNENWQKAGIVIGGGTTGRLYNNVIHTGTGGGIHVFGAGENLIYNNTIVHAGEDGIFCKNVQEVVDKKYGYIILNNTIIEPGGYGLKVNSLPKTANSFCNNWIVQANKHFVANPLQGALTSSHNYFATAKPQISKETFSLLPAPNCLSNLTDKGVDISKYKILIDYFGKQRLTGKAYDIGAQEY